MSTTTSALLCHAASSSVPTAYPRGVRASSSAVNVAPRSLGKWERPQPTSSVDSVPAGPSTPLPKGRSWARPEQPSSPLTPRTPALDKWERREDRRSRDPTPQVSSSSILEREAPPPHQAPGSSSFQRGPAPHQAGPGPSLPSREAAPHQSFNFSVLPRRQQQRQRPPRDTKWQKSGNGVPITSLGNILRKDRIQTDLAGVEKENTDETLEEEEGKTTPSINAGDVAEPLDADSDVAEYSRAGMHARHGWKENGSIVARANNPHLLRMRPGVHTPTYKENKRKGLKNAKPVNLDIFIPSVVTVGNLARLLNVRLDNLRRKMMKVGMEAEASYDHMLTAEYASLLAMEYGRNPVVNDEAAFDIYPPAAPADPSSLPYRPPVVTIMGHVDHGKTTLLDTLRSTSVAKAEAGGITQHIGAFSVPVPASSGEKGQAKTITFLDTPGHAAFSAMRARGARVTDIVVLVVAADDGIMPQTREVVELIKKDDTTVVVAINKVDKPGVDVSKVENALLAEGLQLETFGGDVPSVQVSGLTGQGLDQLVETISLLSEMKDLRAEREGNVHGYVIESKLQKGLGPVATVLISRGCLTSGAYIICGMSNAKVRLLTDSNGKNVKAAYPGTAVTVSGWKELPHAGDEVLQGTESEVKKALENRIRKTEMDATLGDMEALNEQRRLEREQKEKDENGDEDVNNAEAGPANSNDGPKELKLVIKGDVSGSVEAVAGALEGIGNKVARVKIVATGVGDVTESDVLRAKAVNGAVVAFSVNTPRSVQAEANSQQVPVFSSAIIYRLMDTVKERVIALLPPIIERRVTGEATVQQIFDIQMKGRQTKKVAGCRITNGLVEKNKLARVVRNGDTVHEGRLETMKQHKKDITEATKGTECGLAFEGWDDLREGDMIQMCQEIEKPGTL